MTSCRVLSSFCRRSFSTLNFSIIPNEWDPACGQALFLGSLRLAWQRLLRDIAHKVKASLKNAYFREQMRSNWQGNIAAIRHYLHHYQHQHLKKNRKKSYSGLFEIHLSLFITLFACYRGKGLWIELTHTHTYHT